MLRFLKWAIPLGLVAGLALTWLVGSVLTASTNSDVADLPHPASEVRIQSAPGITLAGTYWPATKPDAGAILVLHGNGSNRAGVSVYTKPLVEAGYAVLAIDFRGHGESTPAQKSFGWYEAEDAHAALAWLKAKNPNAKTGAIGLSLGGASAVLGSAGPLPVDALVLNAVYPDIRTAIHNRIAVHALPMLASILEPMLSYQALPRLNVSPDQISPIKALPRVESWVMIVGGEKDEYTPPVETKAMWQAAGKDAEVFILKGLAHDQAVGSLPLEFASRLLAYFDRHLSE